MIDRIDVALLPRDAIASPRSDCYIVIDALRATTVIAVLFARGLRELTVVEGTADARIRRKPGELLLGEEHGLRPQGFDFGNSPVELMQADVREKSAVHVTTNGTSAIASVAACGPTVAGSLVNISAVIAHVSSYRSVAVVCAGNARGSVFSLEDFAVAAAYIQRLAAANPGAKLSDTAKLARALENPESLIAASEHAAITYSLGFSEDIQLASTADAAPSVPLVTEYGPGWAVLIDRAG